MGGFEPAKPILSELVYPGNLGMSTGRTPPQDGWSRERARSSPGVRFPFWSRCSLSTLDGLILRRRGRLGRGLGDRDLEAIGGRLLAVLPEGNDHLVAEGDRLEKPDAGVRHPQNAALTGSRQGPSPLDVGVEQRLSVLAAMDLGREREAREYLFDLVLAVGDLDRAGICDPT